MSTSDYALRTAVTGLASSADYNANSHDVEDSLLGVFGSFVYSGGGVTGGTGLTVHVASGKYFLGVLLAKAALDVTVPANRSGATCAVLWAVTDPDDPERCVYQISSRGTTLARGTIVGEIDTNLTTWTAIRTDASTGRVDWETYASVIADARAAKVKVSATDANADYLANQVIASGLSITTESDGAGGERLRFTVTTATPTAHHLSHETGGGDAIGREALNPQLASSVESLGADPVAPANGRVWYNTAASRLKAAIGGAVRILNDWGSLTNIPATFAPSAHHASHEPGGGDAMAVDAAAGTGSLRTLGTGANQACAGNDARLSGAGPQLISEFGGGVTSGPVTSIVVPIPVAGVRAGSTVLAGLATVATAGAIAATDTKGNSWTLAADNTRSTNNFRGAVLVGDIKTALRHEDSDAITFTLPSVSHASVSCSEWSGLTINSPVDQTVAANGNDTSPASGSTAATLPGPELAYAVICGSVDVSGALTFGAGWTPLTSQVNDVRQAFPAYKLLTGIATPAVTGTFANATPWVAAVVTLQPTPSGGTLQGLLSPLTANLDAGGFEVTNAHDPTTAQSLATRAYVLAQIPPATKHRIYSAYGNTAVVTGTPTTLTRATTSATINLGVRVRQAMTVTDLDIVPVANLGSHSSATYIVTLYKNGSATALTGTLVADGSGTGANVSVHATGTIAVAAGDLLELRASGTDTSDTLDVISDLWASF